MVLITTELGNLLKQKQDFNAHKFSLSSSFHQLNMTETLLPLKTINLQVILPSTFSNQGCLNEQLANMVDLDQTALGAV